MKTLKIFILDALRFLIVCGAFLFICSEPETAVQMAFKLSVLFFICLILILKK